MAAADALDREPSSTQQTIPLKRCYRIRRARGRESARGRQKGRDQYLIGPHKQDRQDPGSPSDHGLTPAFRSPLSRASSREVGVAVAVAGRAIRTTSWPGHGAPARAAAARRTRFERLRRTAFPSFLPATKATRPPGPRPSCVARASTTSTGADTRTPSRKRASISLFDRIVRTSSRSAHAKRVQAERISRPLRRRLASMRRPARVDIRARNPCVLLRLRVLGWYVRFTSYSSDPAPGREQSLVIISAAPSQCQRRQPPQPPRANARYRRPAIQLKKFR